VPNELNRNLSVLLFFVQGVGAVFFGVFSVAYIFALPSIQILTGEPTIHLLLSVFGGLFLLLTIVVFALAAFVKK
jgi:hypothetical protein